MVKRVNALAAWLWFELLWHGNKLIRFGHRAGKLITAICRHLKEGWMARRKRRNLFKKDQQLLEDGITDHVERLVKDGHMARQNANFWYEKMSQIGLPGLGYEPTYGKPWWKPIQVPSPNKVKAKIVGRLMQAKKIMGEEVPGLSVAQIKDRIQQQKEVKKTRKKIVAVRKAA